MRSKVGQGKFAIPSWSKTKVQGCAAHDIIGVEAERSNGGRKVKALYFGRGSSRCGLGVAQLRCFFCSFESN